nr:hypothetical protein [Tanacetum cinerariifolium]
DSPLLGVNTPRSDEDRLKLMELMVFLLLKDFRNTASVKRSDNVTRLQALVDRKKIVISEDIIREILQLYDGKGVVCLPNEEIFAGLAQMGYEKPSTKLTFYKAFFSSQWKFLIHTLPQSLSAKRTFWNEFSTKMASAVICLSKGQKFNFSKYIFDSLVCNVDSSSKFYMYPRFIQLIIQNQLEIIKLKARVKRLERANKVKPSKLKRLRKVGASRLVESSDNIEDVFNQGRMINEDEGIELTEIYNLDLDHPSKVLSMQEDDSEVQEVVEVVTTAKLITDVVTAASQVSAASATISAAKPSIPVASLIVVAAYTRRRKGYIKRYHRMKKKPQTESEAHKNMIAYLKNTACYKVDFFKGMSYDEIRLIFQARFNANIRFLFKTKEEIEEEDQEIIKSINETPAQKVAKRRKLNEKAQEAEKLKKQLEIVNDEDDDVFT